MRWSHLRAARISAWCIVMRPYKSQSVISSDDSNSLIGVLVFINKSVMLSVNESKASKGLYATECNGTRNELTVY